MNRGQQMAEEIVSSSGNIVFISLPDGTKYYSTQKDDFRLQFDFAMHKDIIIAIVTTERKRLVDFFKKEKLFVAATIIDNELDLLPDTSLKNPPDPSSPPPTPAKAPSLPPDANPAD